MEEKSLTQEKEIRIIGKLINVIDKAADELRVLLAVRGLSEKCDVIKKMTGDVRLRLGIDDGTGED